MNPLANIRSHLKRIPTLALLLAAACGSHDQGVARITFSFDSKAPRLNHAAFLFVRVVENKQGGATLGGKDSVPFDPTTGAMLDAITISNGDNRVVIAEIRETASADSRVLYYGISAPFSISPGKTTDVSIVLALSAPPGSAEVRIVGSTGRFVKDPGVTLLLISDTGVEARLSNYVSFPPAVPGITDAPTMTVMLDASTAMPLPGGLVGHMVPWNVNAGLGDPCMLRDYCPRQVFARFIDANAYESETKTASVVLDTKPPSVVPGSVAVLLSAPARNPLTSVQKVTLGSTASVTFTLSELILGTLDVSSGEIAHWTCNGSELTYLCSAKIPMGATEGPHMIVLSATDLAGNAGQFPLAAFDVDLTPPTIPDTSAGRILYTRVPWGRGSSVAVSRYTLKGGPGAVEPGATVVAYNGPDIASNEEIGRATASADGSFNELELSRTDRDQVYVIALDSAGNESDASSAPGIQAALVRDADWVATLSRNASFNPHRGFSVPTVRPSLVQDRDSIHDFTAEDSAGVSGRGAGSLDVPFSAAWSAIVPTAINPTVQTEHAMAFDRARGVLVLFGGNFQDLSNPGSAATTSGDTWEWDGHSWKKVIPLGESPSPRFSHQMVYDAARSEVLLFGGNDGSQQLQDTWGWDGARWIELATTSGQIPPRRQAHQMTYDSARGRAVLFGGVDLSTGVALLQDTWEWDGDKWLAMNPTHPPNARGASSLAYDPIRSRTVLFGGSVTTGQLDDTWEWDGSAWKVATSSMASRPAARRNHQMAFDETLGRVVLFGGDALDANGAGPVFGDTWTWTGTRWSTTSASFALGISQHAMSYDAARRQLVVFGGIGQDPTAIFTDTLISFQGAWKKVTPTGVVPPPRERGAIAYDPTSGGMVLYGGIAVDFSPLFDTWTWDGYNWSAVPMGASDPFTGGAVMAFDEARRTIVLAGLTDPSTPSAPEGVFEFSNGQWSAPTSTTSPPERDLSAMAFDAARGRPMMFGGVFDPLGANMPSGDGWAWNGSVWVTSDPVVADQVPSPRFGHSMAGDTIRKRIVLFGGVAPDQTGSTVEQADTWEWNGTSRSWTKASTTAASPPPDPRLSHRMTYDVARHRTLLFGGENFTGTLFGDLWQWDGKNWLAIPLKGARPAPRARTSLAYDPVRKTTVLFGGFTIGAVSDTWEWKITSDDRPGAFFTIDWTKSNEPTDAIGSIEVSAIAGGIGYTDAASGNGTPDPGAAIEAWDAYAGAWSRLGANAAMTSAPDNLSASTPMGASARFVDGRGQITVRITTKTGAGNGPAFPDLVVDDLAVIVHYRR